MLEFPNNEAARLEDLRRLRIADDELEPAFDAFARLASRICGSEEAHVSIVTSDRQVFKTSGGRVNRSSPRHLSFCAHVVLAGDAMVVEDARLDVRFQDNPLVTGDPFIRFYAGVPLFSAAGRVLGTLCVINYQPLKLSTRQLQSLTWLARQVELQMELRQRLFTVTDVAGTLGSVRQREQKETAELIGMAVHDLKSPLASIMANSRFVMEQTEVPGVREAVVESCLAAEAAIRMLTDLLDVTLAQVSRLRPRYSWTEPQALVTRVRQTCGVMARERKMTLELDAGTQFEAVETDADMMWRVLVNLVENAIKYGPPGQTIRLELAQEPQTLIFRVRDQGRGIPDHAKACIFDRGVRLTDEDPGRGSRGLGLYYCTAATAALGGSISVEDNRPQGAIFVVRVPTHPVPAAS